MAEQHLDWLAGIDHRFPCDVWTLPIEVVRFGKTWPFAGRLLLDKKLRKLSFTTAFADPPRARNGP